VTQNFVTDVSLRLVAWCSW